MMKRLEEMLQCLIEGRKEVQPAKWWVELNQKNVDQLSKYGYKNFKRTVVKNYFTWSLMAPWNPQVIFLLSNVKPSTTIKNIFKTIFLLKHEYLTLMESLVVNFLTFMVWEYAKIDNSYILDKLNEPTIGNPPKIYLNNKLISQDIANSVIEFKSIMEPITGKNSIKTIGELGGGYGRNAYVFLSMMQGIKYIMIDIPPALYIAERYLTDVFPEKKIFKFRKFDCYSEIKEEFECAEILFFVSSQIELLPNKIIDLFINISSLHEMRLEQIQYYFAEIERLTKNNGYFYIKEWKDAFVPFEDDDIHIKMEDYPVRSWTKIFWREAKVQTQFFEALLRLN